MNDKIRNEDSIIPNGTSRNDVPYINMVDEGLRLFPPVWLISRESTDDIIYEGLTISLKTLLLYNVIRKFGVMMRTNLDLTDLKN